MKRFRTCLIALSIVLSVCLPVSAASSFPSAFWKLADSFTQACDDADDENIISIGIQICELLESSPKNADTIAVLGTRYQDIALAYERREDFDSAAYYYEKYLPYGEQLGWDDGVRIAEAKIDCFKTIIDLYVETDTNSVWYGAKNEPTSGVLYGKATDTIDENDSMILIYSEFGEPLSGWCKNMLIKAAERGMAVELAWNFPQEGYTASAVPDMTEYIQSFLYDVKEFSSQIPIYLRIGAEVDVWTNRCEPEVFVAAYRAIAEQARNIIPDAALVWSVNYVSGWDVNVDEYYPGDEYVDWVGISAYMVRYFQDKLYEKDDRIDEILFTAGRAADPVFMVKKIVETYGDRKPIMIAECGASHTNAHFGDTTEWATKRLREAYGYLPMVYPQIKLMAYFNNKIASESNDYSLKNSAVLQETFAAATSAPAFIRNDASKSGKSYAKLTDGHTVAKNCAIATYVHLYDKDDYLVEYRVDGVWTALSNTAPYRVTLRLTPGEHVITVNILSADGAPIASESRTVTADNAIILLCNDIELKGDVPACVVSGRTLVPLRLIFSALGAEVEWDGETQTITSTLGEKTVILRVGDTEMLRDGESVPLDVPPTVMNSRTLVPVRAVAEAFGASVEWDPDTRTVSIHS